MVSTSLSLAADPSYRWEERWQSALRKVLTSLLNFCLSLMAMMSSGRLFHLLVIDRRNVLE